MSTNCIRCVTKDRTGPDLLCDDCRSAGLKLQKPAGWKKIFEQFRADINEKDAELKTERHLTAVLTAEIRRLEAEAVILRDENVDWPAERRAIYFDAAVMARQRGHYRLAKSLEGEGDHPPSLEQVLKRIECGAPPAVKDVQRR